jgi:hypothetical protein
MRQRPEEESMAVEQRNPLRSRGDDLAVITGLVVASFAVVRVIPMVRARLRGPEPSSPEAGGHEATAAPPLADRSNGHQASTAGTATGGEVVAPELR